MMKHDLVLVVDNQPYYVLKVTMARLDKPATMAAASKRLRKYADMYDEGTHIVTRVSGKNAYYYVCRLLDLEEMVEDD